MERKYKSKEELLERGRGIIGIPLKDIDVTHRLDSGKGAIGTVVEESWYGYAANSTAGADFAELNVELKVTPFIVTKKGIRAKERLVCNIINYMEEYKKVFYTSSFWQKCNAMLLMFYEHLLDVSKGEYSIKEVILFSFPTADLIIIQQDWEKIIGKIRAGKAHELSEGDTMCLGACPKGATSASVRQQPFSKTPAKQRAYSLKQTYMTHILNKYVFGANEDEHIIKDPTVLQGKSFESFIQGKLSPYFGYTNEMLLQEFGIETKAKNANEIILARILGVEGRISRTDEFKKAGIVPKTIRIQSDGHIKENMSFPAFSFKEIVNETWEESTLKNYLEPTRFLFVVFREVGCQTYILQGIMFWNIPLMDLEEVRQVWERTVRIIKEGVKLTRVGKVTKNNLPKKTENRVAHIRPHARDANDTDTLPDGREMAKQCFWLNNNYIESVILNMSM